MEQIINLPEMKPEVMKLAEKLFNEILSSPDRIDDKPRTGFALSMWTLPMSRNAFIGSVGNPSDIAVILSVQKSTISNERGDYSSMNHEDPSKMLFSGSLTIDFGRYSIQCGGSGLIGIEDTAVSAILLAYVTKQEVFDVLLNVFKERNGKFGRLPEEFHKKGHYLNSLLVKYNKAFIN